MTLYHHEKHPHSPKNVNEIHKREQRGFNTKIAVVITRVFGSMPAFYILVAWMFIWMVLASAGIWLFALDKFPFPFLLFLSNLIQLWALPVLAVGQNVLSKKQELQADEMYATTQHSFHDIEGIMKHLDAQDDKILEIDTAILEIIKRLEDQQSSRKLLCDSSVLQRESEQ